MIHYCKKCGRFIEKMSKDRKVCDCCSSIVYPVPKEYIDNFRWRDGDGKEALINELVKPSPEFDQYLFDHRDEILANKHIAFQAHVNAGKAILEEKSRVPKCPSCGSSNVSKISTLSRVVSTGIFGLASSKIGKTHKCNQCGTTW